MNRLLAIMLVLVMVLFSAELQAGEHRIGGGVNYWIALDDIDEDDIDEQGFSYLVSYQHWWNILGLELDVELLPDRFGEDAFAPQAYVLFGSTIYGGAGIGIVNYDGDFADEPFFALRAGLNLELLPKVFVDISANYRFNDSADLENKDTDIDTDTIFLGAAVRFTL